jgi:hypothetical protein
MSSIVELDKMVRQQPLGWAIEIAATVAIANKLARLPSQVHL